MPFHETYLGRVKWIFITKLKLQLEVFPFVKRACNAFHVDDPADDKKNHISVKFNPVVGVLTVTSSVRPAQNQRSHQVVVPSSTT